MQVKIQKVEELLSLLKSGEEEKAQAVLSELTQLSQSNLVHQVEEITQNLQKTLNEFGEDAEILMQTKHDLPDVSERLEYVIKTTEDASNDTLDAAENAIAIIETIRTKLAASDSIETELEQLNASLTNIMSAQSFQDLTGQVLKRVMMLVGSLESSLLALIQDSGINYDAIPQRNLSDADKKSAEMKGVGPNVTHSGKVDSVASQDDVDDLLGDLGI